MNQVLNGQLRAFDRQYRLTDAQKQKLLLAGQGDIKRALDRVQDLRARFQRVKYERNAVIECIQEAGRLRRELETLTPGVNSLLVKTIATTVTEDQKAREAELLHEYQSGRFEAALTEAAAKMVPVLNLSPEQQRRLEKLLLSEIRPPRRFGELNLRLYHVPVVQATRGEGPAHVQRFPVEVPPRDADVVEQSRETPRR